MTEQIVLTRRLATALLHGFEDIELNGQTVTIPAWHIMNPVTRHEFVSEVDVFEHLVDHMAHVDVAIGVGRTVVENEQRLGIAYLSSLLLPFVQAVKGGYLDSETRSSKHLSMPTHFITHTHIWLLHLHTLLISASILQMFFMDNSKLPELGKLSVFL